MGFLPIVVAITNAQNFSKEIMVLQTPRSHVSGEQLREAWHFQIAS